MSRRGCLVVNTSDGNIDFSIIISTTRINLQLNLHRSVVGRLHFQERWPDETSERYHAQRPLHIRNRAYEASQVTLAGLQYVVYKGPPHFAGFFFRRIFAASAVIGRLLGPGRDRRWAIGPDSSSDYRRPISHRSYGSYRRHSRIRPDD